MSTISSQKRGRSYEVADPMDEDGRLVVRDPVTDVRYSIVEYTDELVYERLASEPAGARVRVELAGAPSQPDSYVATRVVTGGSVAL